MAFITMSQQMLSDMFTNWLSTNTTSYAILTNSSSYTFSSAMLAVVQQEVSNLYGYARVAFSPAAGSYNGAKTRFEFPATTLSFTASGGAIQFDTIYFIGGGKSYSNRAVSNINTGSNRLEFAAAHPFSNGDKVTVTADAGGTVPTALLSGGNPTTLFVVGSSNANPYYIQLAATSGGSAITFTGGANTIRVRSVDGVPGFYATIGSTTIADGQTYNFSTQFITGGSGVNVQS
jgi:hypothetical protein